MSALGQRQALLLALRRARDMVAASRYVHVFANDKFCKGIVAFISENFPTGEHCFVFIGGLPPEQMPLPDYPNVCSFPTPHCLANSEHVDKFVFHGMYVPGIAQYLCKNQDILDKSYWLPWGRDIYQGFDPYDSFLDDDAMRFVKSRMRGVAANAYIKKIYQQNYNGSPTFFPYDISYESIPYALISATTSPAHEHLQVLVNNSTHKSTLEALDALAKFRHENIRVATILSYGDYPHPEEIKKRGASLFGANFIPVERFLPPEQYIKFLARNDVLILNQNRPQGMATFFTMLLLGKKVFMPAHTSAYLRDDGYQIADTASIPQLSLQELAHQEGVEQNRTLAARRFDPAHVRAFWSRIFAHNPDAAPAVNKDTP